MQRLSSQDASFLHLEDEVSHMHIGSVAILEGPPPAYDELAAHVHSKLPQVPRYRQRVHFLPLALGRPVWVDDPHFNLGYHLRRTALPDPGGDDELRNLVGRVMSQQLDRNKPLWEMWMVEGLSENRWVLLSKIHHAIVDGVAGAELLSVILDEDRREPASTPVDDDWQPEEQPSGAGLAARALVERASSPYGSVRSLVRAPRQAAELAAATADGLMTLAGVVSPPPPSSLNGPIGPHRRWDWARSELSDVKQIREGFGGTVNDVVLTAISGGFRELLASRGESTDRVVRTLVPVSVRRQDEREYNNRVSAIFANLPVGIADPVERLAAVHEQMEHLKQSHSAVAGDVLVGLSGFAPALLLSMGLRAATRVPQRSVQTVTTNVPGPQKTLYAAGRRLLEAFPYVPLAGRVRIGVAIFSYDGGLHFGVTGDWDSAPDVEVLCRGIEDSMAELLTAAQPKDTDPGVGSPGVRAAPAESPRP
ncbi:MAG TPA: wax ester/triacylglycerol synthase family O-acyltransferase [Thermoleophilaceae bacterium]|jgi:WS/DGAT/MGAT family acyltransferase